MIRIAWHLAGCKIDLGERLNGVSAQPWAGSGFCVGFSPLREMWSVPEVRAAAFGSDGEDSSITGRTGAKFTAKRLKPDYTYDDKRSQEEACDDKAGTHTGVAQSSCP